MARKRESGYYEIYNTLTDGYELVHGSEVVATIKRGKVIAKDRNYEEEIKTWAQELGMKIKWR